jgi:hypothetical protein
MRKLFPAIIVLAVELFGGSEADRVDLTRANSLR